MALTGLGLRGRTVAIFATGPSATSAAAHAARWMPCVAVKSAYRVAPEAIALVAHDASWWLANPAARLFRGVRISGQPAGPGVEVVPAAEEHVTLADGRKAEFRSSGIMAVRLVAADVPRRIILFGFDGGGMRADGTRRPWDAVAPAAKALEDLISDLGDQGIDVARAEDFACT